MPVIKIHYFSDDLPRLQKKPARAIGSICTAHRPWSFTRGSMPLVPLGVSMQLPEGYEARTAPRSSTFKRWGHSAGQLRRRDRQQLLRHE